MIGDMLSTKQIMVVAGSGGVGKTTTAAAIAVQAALQTNRRVLVITVDPARRLADALGHDALGDTPIEVDAASFDEAGFTGPTAPKGRLFACMLDTKKAWDELVHRHAPDAETAEAILNNPLYKNIAGRFVQSHDYIAMERLYQLHNDGEYDLIVVDTPPSAHAVDLLDAPQRLADFFDSRLLKFLVAPSKSRIAQLTSRPFLQIADRLLGKRFLSDISEFFTMLESMRPGFIERAKLVDDLIRSDVATFLVVTTLEPAAAHEAQRFVAELDERKLELGALILNRVLPESLTASDVVDAERDVTARSKEIALSFGKQALGKQVPDLGDVEKLVRVLDELAANAVRLSTLADQQQKRSAELAGRAKILAKIPWFEEELRNLSGLAKLGKQIW